MEQKSDTITGVNTEFKSLRGRWFIFFAIMAALGVTLYGKSLYALAMAVLHREGSSHGLFVPFISAYLIWLKFDKIKALTPRMALVPGTVMVAAGAVLFILSQGREGYSLQVLSFLSIAGGLILVLFGSQMFKEVGFPLFFLGAMIPIPQGVDKWIADRMAQTSTWGAVVLTKAMGVPLLREGLNIYLPDIHLYVDHGCSGIRYLLSYLVFGIAYAFRFKKSIQGRALVLIGAVPLSLIGGMLRLSIIFISAYYIGPIMVEHRPHVMLSWTVFTVLLVGVIAVDRYLSRKKLTKVTRELK